MAASADPSGNQDGSHAPSSFNGASSGGNTSNGNSGSVVENSATAQALKHNPGLSSEWTVDEQSILEEGFIKYASESIMVRYAKIAMQLNDKTVRDVALRCRWMTITERISDPSAKSSPHITARPNVPSYALPMIPMDNDDGISYKAIGGATGQLLEQNAQVFNQISANLAAHQTQENISLFYQTRDNIFTILNKTVIIKVNINAPTLNDSNNGKTGFITFQPYCSLCEADSLNISHYCFTFEVVYHLLQFRATFQIVLIMYLNCSQSHICASTDFIIYLYNIATIFGIVLCEADLLYISHYVFTLKLYHPLQLRATFPNHSPIVPTIEYFLLDGFHIAAAKS
ncbi:hypothetical protein HHK36_013328 [Tetracentron sinense]|uniref:Myb-like domain-containing protein n=1 Tax=Tetracentron sinense TaxID=13715 RepID=A0A835DGC4_TETSI|nr:hypothetical protein HHK36_013328 [Tetracentron sinense]